jgi:AhpD family alkylhydroperoxidase
MKPRLNPYQAALDAMKAAAALNTYVQGSGLEPNLVELIKMRASQTNGCAYRLHMHCATPAKGESEERLYLLRCVARVTALHRSRARGTGLDRGSDIGVASPCAG